MKIAGITFRRGVVRWEDAFKVHKQSAAEVLSTLGGPVFYSGPWYARVGKRVVICHEYDPRTETGDFTVIPASLVRK